MNASQKNNLKGVALAVLLAGGMGVARIVDGAQRLLQKVSRNLAVNVADLKTLADAAHEEAMGEIPIAKDKH